MTQQNTKFTLEPGEFVVDDFPAALNGWNGLFPMPVTMDLTVGEEVALYWLDRTPFVHDLARIRPFQFFMKSGLYRTDCGPLMWLLFYVPNPEPLPRPFALMECHINPCDSDQVALWRRLACQSHWHLSLLGAGNKVADFFEFENVFGLWATLDVVEAACRGLRVTDFLAAKRQFSARFTMDDLFAMA